MRSPPPPVKGSSEPSVRILSYVHTNGSGSYFDALRAVHAMSYAGGVRRRNFAPVLHAGHPPGKSLKGTSNEVDSDQLNLLVQLLSI